nr:hypothetical protein [Candidatus Woesearchaeota archaeon]
MLKLPMRIWILIVFLILSVIAISPNPFAKGIVISSVNAGSQADLEGINPGERVFEVNRITIESVADFNLEVNKLKIPPFLLEVKTDKETYRYNATQDFGFKVDENLTVIYSDYIKVRDKILEINNEKIETLDELNKVEEKLFPKNKFVLKTDKKEYAFLVSGDPGIKVEKAKKTNLITGLDLQGGTRVLIQPVSDSEITDKQVSDLIHVMENRLNVFGLSDLKIRQANDLEGKKFVLIEIAGVGREEVEDLIGKQGRFEAKIGEDLVFNGGEKDVVFVCRDDGSCSGIKGCFSEAQGYSCQFQFQITLSNEAAARQANATKDLEINFTETGDYLEKNLDLYLDDKLVDSLRIGSDLKGREATSIVISGPGFGGTEEAAVDDALKNMNQLQTILITGSLPLDIEIVKLDSISPTLGEGFIKNLTFIIILAIIAVTLILILRYKKLKIVIPVLITILSEILITLGVAAFIKWNLDIVSLAGIIAAVGTGVDDQIIMIDEILKGKTEYTSWKEKIKRAFFIIMAAYATTVAAMIPLIWAGAGLVRGFAVLTIIGVTIGVFITRPAFAAVSEKLFG